MGPIWNIQLLHGQINISSGSLPSSMVNLIIACYNKVDHTTLPGILNIVMIFEFAESG